MFVAQVSNAIEAQAGTLLEFVGDEVGDEWRMI